MDIKRLHQEEGLGQEFDDFCHVFTVKKRKDGIEITQENRFPYGKIILYTIGVFIALYFDASIWIVILIAFILLDFSVLFIRRVSKSKVLIKHGVISLSKSITGVTYYTKQCGSDEKVYISRDYTKGGTSYAVYLQKEEKSIRLLRLGKLMLTDLNLEDVNSCFEFQVKLKTLKRVTSEKHLKYLLELDNTLSKGGNLGQVEIITNLINLLNRNEILLYCKELNSVNMWGGSGAVWETCHGMSLEEGDVFRSVLKDLLVQMKGDDVLDKRGASTLRFLS